MRNIIFSTILIAAALVPSLALAGGNQYDYYDYGYTTYARPVVVDPYTGPYDGGLEWTMDGNNNLMNRLLDRVWYQIQAPWPYETEPFSYYAPEVYAPQPAPIQSQPWYSDWSWSSWFGWNW